MFKYNLKLALKSMRRNPIMTTLMVASHAFEGEFQVVFEHLNDPVQSCAANG